MFLFTQRRLNLIEGIGLSLILISSFTQLFQEELRGSQDRYEYYKLHRKLDDMWSVLSHQYAESHPKDSISFAIDFKYYMDNWKIYSQQINDTKDIESDLSLFNKVQFLIFILGSMMLIFPKFIEPKEITVSSKASILYRRN